MIQFMRFDPPFSGFHKQVRIGILIREKRIKRKTYGLSLFFDFLVADRNRFGS